MTGFEHQIGTVLIYPIAPITEFGIYNSINAQTPLTIAASITYPTDKDYENGSYERFFARRANDKRSTGFEVSKSNFQKSPLYIYTSLTWFLTGTSDFVYDKNQEQIEIAKETLPLIYKILNPHQFFIPNNNLTPKELTEQRLGISTSKGDEWVGLTEEELERRRARNQSLESAMTEGGGANIAEQGPPTSGY